MRNRFIDYLIEKNRQEEEQAMNESWSINNDPTQYDPWEDSPFDNNDNKDNK